VYLDDRAPNDLLTQHANRIYAEFSGRNPKVQFDEFRKIMKNESRANLLERLKYFLFADIDPYNLGKVRFNSSNEILEHFEDDELYGY
jgi:hypothetical protein